MTTQEHTQNKGRRRMTLRTAVIAVLAVSIATPVLAAAFINNFLVAEFESEAACFVKVASADATDFPAYVQVDTANTVAADNVLLLQEKMHVSGFDGDRTMYTDVLRYQNNCTNDLSVVLQIEEAPDAAGTVLNWPAGDALSVEIHNTTAVAAATAPTLPWVAPWSGAPIDISSAGVASGSPTAAVVLAPGEEMIAGFEIDAADGYITPAAGPFPTVYYTARAQILP